MKPGGQAGASEHPVSIAPFSLSTDRLDLRPLVEADAPALFAIHSDPVTMRYWSTPPWTDVTDAAPILERDRRGLADGTAARLGLCLSGTSTVIGTCTLFNIQQGNRRAEIGYALLRAYWGRG